MNVVGAAYSHQAASYSLVALFVLSYQITIANAMVRPKQRAKSKLTNVESGQRAIAQYDTSADAIAALTMNDDDEYFQDPNSLLLRYIRSRTKPYRRPVLHAHDLVSVHVRSSLYQIVDIDQRNNLLTLSAYFDVWWLDSFIPWNVSDFDGITHTFAPVRWIWKPEFYLYHSIQGRIPDYDPAGMLEVRHDGRIRLFVPITSRALCPINVKYFPYDTQNCSFLVGSWSYQSRFVRFIVEDNEVFLGDFCDNQEWLLMSAQIQNGSMNYIGNESFSMVLITLILQRQSFYYVFNLVFPTTLVSLVAVIAFHAPINATGQRESKFRLGVMTLLSLSVMLLMLVDEMKFALESIPGQRGSFSNVPLIGIYYMSLILVISVATCTSTVFVHLEKFALRNPHFGAIPYWLRFLSAKQVLCGYASRRFRMDKDEGVQRNAKGVRTHVNHSSADATVLSTIFPTQLNFTEFSRERARQIASEAIVLEALPPQPPPDVQKLDVLIALMRDMLDIRRGLRARNQLPVHWERVIRRLENCSLTFYLSLIGLNVTMFLWPELWY